MCQINILFVILNGQQQDTIHENQVLYNGREWNNLYFMINKDQFLFTSDFLPGSVTIRGREFKNVKLRYDIFNDEILIPGNPGGILQLNKEMIDSFSIFFQNKFYRFIRMPDDNIMGLQGFYNILHQGEISLYVKYRKKIDKLTFKGENDEFYQISQVFLMKNSSIHLITGKNDLLKALDFDKNLIGDYIKKNKITISKEYPEKIVPIIMFIKTLRE